MHRMLSEEAMTRIEKKQEYKINSGGIGFFDLLTVAFIVLKLCKVIDWPWLWVLSPIVMPIIAVMLFLGTLLLISLIKDCLKLKIEINREAIIDLLFRKIGLF